MFEVDPERTWVDPSQGSITAIIQSLNKPLVAAGPHPAEEVQSWILTKAAKGGGAYEVIVFFHLTQSRQAVVYRWDGGPVPPPQLSYVQDEAMAFCESMGFMMDNMNFGNLPPARREDLLGSLAPFVEDLASLKPSEDITEQEPQAKKKVDPLEDFRRAKEALAESGQVTTRDFVVEAEEPSGADPSLDPSARQGPASGPVEEMQIEITEIEGLEMIPDDGAAAKIAPPPGDDSGPPLVVGTVPASDSGAIPVVQGRAAGKEGTPKPKGGVQVFDESHFETQVMDGPPPPAPAAKGAFGGGRKERELSLDEMLDDPPANGSGGEDLASALDDILDGVESSKTGKKAKDKGKEPAKPAPAAKVPPSKPAAAPPPAPPPEVDDISIELEVEPVPAAAKGGSPDDLSADSMSALESLVGGGSTTLGAPPESKEEEISVEAIDAGTVPGEPPAPRDPTSIRNLEAAWAEGSKEVSGNGHGRPKPGTAPVTGTTEDLARLLAML